jgi:hypothetical protein
MINTQTTPLPNIGFRACHHMPRTIMSLPLFPHSVPLKMDLGKKVPPKDVMAVPSHLYPTIPIRRHHLDRIMRSTGSWDGMRLSTRNRSLWITLAPTWKSTELHISIAMGGLSAHRSCGSQVLRLGAIRLDSISQLRANLVHGTWDTTRTRVSSPTHERLCKVRTLSSKRDATVPVSDNKHHKRIRMCHCALQTRNTI